MSQCTLPALLALIGVLMAGTALAAKSPTLSVIVVTDHDHPVTGVKTLQRRGIDVQIQYLDAPGRLLAKLNRELPGDPRAAAAVAKQRLHKIGIARFKRSIAALQTALANRLQRYPAVIFNGDAIVLGVTNLTSALAHYERWRTSQSTPSP